MLSLPYACTRPCGPKVFLLLPALASPSTSAVVCARPWIIAQLPTASGNTVLQPSWRPSERQQISWVPCIQGGRATRHVHWRWIYAYMHGGPPNVDFTLTLRLVLVWIRMRVSMMVIVFAFSVWIRRFRPIFPLSQVELCLAVRQRWLTAANFDRRSHCSGTMPNFYFREARQLWTLYRHPLPCDFFWKRTKHQQTDKTQKFLDTRSSISQSASTCLCSGAPRPVGDLAGAATSLATESTGTVLTPGQMSEIAGHHVRSVARCPNGIPTGFFDSREWPTAKSWGYWLLMTFCQERNRSTNGNWWSSTHYSTNEAEWIRPS